jgi:polysaccharide pyruvyl transferase WcaK-like protein
MRFLRAGRDSVHALRGGAEEAAFSIQRYRWARGLDLLIVAGSNQLSDYVGGPWGFPYRLAAWCAAAKLAGTPVAFLSVGAGPVRAPLSRRFIRSALSSAAFRSYRDVGSRETIRGIGVPGPHVVAPDLAHGLRLPAAAIRPPRLTGPGRIVAVNPLPYFDPRFWAENDPHVYRRYVETLASFAEALRTHGDRVRFIPTQLRADPPVIADIVQVLKERGWPGDASDLAPQVRTFEDLMRELGEADLVVATRFHGAVLGLMAGRPVIGIAYRRSTTDLLEDAGLGPCAIDAADLTVEGLLERIRLVESDPEVVDRIRRRMAEHREAIGAQYDALLRMGSAVPAGAG